jgi:hypothetical protein
MTTIPERKHNMDIDSDGLEVSISRDDLAVNKFVTRQVPGSRFSYHESLSHEEILDLAQQHWDKQQPGYRDGVILVPVPIDGFVSGIVPLATATAVKVTHEPRCPGEEPVLQVVARGPRLTPSQVNLIFYRHDVLAEDKDNTTDREWELISINAGCGEPIPPATMMRNQLHLKGGTAALYSSEEWAASVRFWEAHADFWPESNA